MRVFAQERLTAISRLFSSAVLQELARKGRSPLFSALVRTSDLQASLPRPSLVADAFDQAFTYLRREGFRDEYVYKSALVHKILLGRHSLRTASVLNEFRVGECKADLAIINGTSTVYEVKSERDSLVRLARQVRTYSEVFARVYVVTADAHLKGVADSISEEVGIMRLNERFQISIIREAMDNPDRTSPTSIFDSIRTEEARMVLSLFGVTVPDVPNTQLSALLRGYFIKLDPRKAHEGMVEVLKKSRNQVRLAELLAQLPASLRAAVLSTPLRIMDHARLIGAINTRLEDAVAWG
jgi:hypothetical protein